MIFTKNDRKQYKKYKKLQEKTKITKFERLKDVDKFLGKDL